MTFVCMWVLKAVALGKVTDRVSLGGKGAAPEGTWSRVTLGPAKGPQRALPGELVVGQGPCARVFRKFLSYGCGRLWKTQKGLRNRNHEQSDMCLRKAGNSICSPVCAVQSWALLGIQVELIFVCSPH